MDLCGKSQDIVLSASQTLIFQNSKFDPPAGVICMTYVYVLLVGLYVWSPASRRDADLGKGHTSFSAGQKKPPEGGNGVMRGSFRGKTFTFSRIVFYFKYYEIAFLNFIASEILLKLPEVLT